MSIVLCPRCSQESKGKAYRYQQGGYARCPYCNVGIEYSSMLFKQNIEPVRSYIPQGCSISPKTNNILCGHRVHKCGRFISYFFKKLSRDPNPWSQSKRKGTLQKSLRKI